MPVSASERVFVSFMRQPYIRFSVLVVLISIRACFILALFHTLTIKPCLAGLRSAFDVHLVAANLRRLPCRLTSLRRSGARPVGCGASRAKAASGCLCFLFFCVSLFSVCVCGYVCVCALVLSVLVFFLAPSHIIGHSPSHMLSRFRVAFVRQDSLPYFW